MAYAPSGELVTYIKKILGKYRKDEGIYVFSKPALNIILSEKQITTTRYVTEDIDLNLYDFKLLFIENKQDVMVYVDFYVKPSIGSTMKALLRTIEVNPNDITIAIFNDRYPACNLEFYTTTAPTKGYVNCLLASWS